MRGTRTRAVLIGPTLKETRRRPGMTYRICVRSRIASVTLTVSVSTCGTVSSGAGAARPGANATECAGARRRSPGLAITTLSQVAFVRASSRASTDNRTRLRLSSCRVSCYVLATHAHRGQWPRQSGAESAPRQRTVPSIDAGTRTRRRRLTAHRTTRDRTRPDRGVRGTCAVDRSCMVTQIMFYCLIVLGCDGDTCTVYGDRNVGTKRQQSAFVSRRASSPWERGLEPAVHLRPWAALRRRPGPAPPLPHSAVRSVTSRPAGVEPPRAESAAARPFCGI